VKISKKQLKNIISEEIQNILSENLEQWAIQERNVPGPESVASPSFKLPQASAESGKKILKALRKQHPQKWQRALKDAKKMLKPFVDAKKEFEQIKGKCKGNTTCEKRADAVVSALLKKKDQEIKNLFRKELEKIKSSIPRKPSAESSDTVIAPGLTEGSGTETLKKVGGGILKGIGITAKYALIAVGSIISAVFIAIESVMLYHMAKAYYKKPEVRESSILWDDMVKRFASIIFGISVLLASISTAIVGWPVAIVAGVVYIGLFFRKSLGRLAKQVVKRGPGFLKLLFMKGGEGILCALLGSSMGCLSRPARHGM